MENYLKSGEKADKMNEGPKHIGIILDGNRRYAKKLMLNPFKGHEKGAEKFKEFLEWCEELGVKQITAYCFSMQNFNRTEDEINFLTNLFKKIAEDMLKEDNLKQLQEKGARVRFIGRIDLFPEKLQTAAQKLEEKTKDNRNYELNLAMAYGGREEITDAVKRIAEKIRNGEISPEEVDEKIIQENLYLQNEPDLIIRTSGEKRTSNFLPWQAVYSEWFFIDKTWPEIEKDDLKAIIEEYKTKRQRRFGK